MVFFVLVYMRCTGGEVGATSALAPKIGPLGLVSTGTFIFYRGCLCVSTSGILPFVLFFSPSFLLWRLTPLIAQYLPEPLQWKGTF